MTQHTDPTAEQERKPSLWARFQALSRGKKILAAIVALVIIGMFASNLSPTESQDETETEEAATVGPDDDTEATDGDQDDAEEAEDVEPAPQETSDAYGDLPDDIDAQVEALGDLEAFDGAEVSHRTPEQGEVDHAIFISKEYEPASFISSTVCTYAQEDTITALEFARDHITEDYDRIQVSFITRGEADATGDAPIVGLATLNYERDTVEAIDSDHVSPANVWEARDDGSMGPTCR